MSNDKAKNDAHKDLCEEYGYIMDDRSEFIPTTEELE